MRIRCYLSVFMVRSEGPFPHESIRFHGAGYLDSRRGTSSPTSSTIESRNSPPNDTASWHAKRLGVPKLPENLELLQKKEDFRNWGLLQKNPCNGEGFWVGVWIQKEFGSNNKTQKVQLHRVDAGTF